MTTNHDNYRAALALMDDVVQQIPDDGWEAATPCDGWTVADVVGHCLAVMTALRGQAETGQMHRPGGPEQLPDGVTSWNEARDATLAVLATPGTLDRQGDYWNGPGTVDNLLAFAMWDPLTHGWDVASAIGVEFSGADELALASMPVIEAMAPTLRSLGHLGEPCDAPQGATPMDRFLALTGRDPAGSAAN